jgi:hypothetical protein
MTTAGVDVQSAVVIGAPLLDVAEFAANPSCAPFWHAHVRSVHWQTPPPLTLGSRVTFVAPGLLRRTVYTYEVVSFTPGERLVMRTARGPLSLELTYTWTALGPNQTQMTLRTKGQLGGIANLVGPLVAPAVRKSSTENLHRLKDYLEPRRVVGFSEWAGRARMR